MRIRLIGEHVHVSIAVLAVVELAFCYAAFVLAAHVRFGRALTGFEGVYGPLWPRALVFGVVMMLCLLAFGLYSARQRARAFGIVVRVGAAIPARIAGTAGVWYGVPGLRVGGRAMILARVASIVAITLPRTVSSRLANE